MSGRVLLKEGGGGIILRDVQEYLIRYGYGGANIRAESSLEEKGATWIAIAKFQKFFGLDVTGVVDKDTFAVMRTERCGFLDDAIPCRWSKDVKELIYEFGAETEDEPPPGRAFKGVQEAIDVWNDVLDSLGIDLLLRKKKVEDGVAHVKFDWKPAGVDRILVGPPVAHADFPPDCSVFTIDIPKPVHFDDDVRWSRGKASGKFHIKSIAMHELGHILGLGHAPVSVPGSIMFPLLQDGFVHPGPTKEDEDVLRELYK